MIEINLSSGWWSSKQLHLAFTKLVSHKWHKQAFEKFEDEICNRYVIPTLGNLRVSDFLVVHEAIKNDDPVMKFREVK